MLALNASVATAACAYGSPTHCLALPCRSASSSRAQRARERSAGRPATRRSDPRIGSAIGAPTQIGSAIGAPTRPRIGSAIGAPARNGHGEPPRQAAAAVAHGAARACAPRALPRVSKAAGWLRRDPALGFVRAVRLQIVNTGAGRAELAGGGRAFPVLHCTRAD